MTTDPVHAHRVDYWTWVDLHAVPSMRDNLLRLRDHWHEANLRHFNGEMTLPYITLTVPSKPSLLGQCCAVSSWGSRLEIKLRPSLLSGDHPALVSGDQHEPGRLRFAADVLLHETIHQYHQEITGKTEASYHGHGPAFTATANAIGARLGLPEVVARNRGGSSLAKATQWPHCVRDPAYYLGAYRVPSTTDASPPPETVTCPHCDGSGKVPAGDES